MASRLRRRAVVLPSVAVLVVGGGAMAWAQQDDAGPGFRTAVVRTGDVTELLSLTGTVSVVDQAKARFRTSGTVATVSAAVGERVAKGQVLAILDTGPLQDAVTAARATLAQARATLETDSTSSTSSSTPSSSGDRPGTGPTALQQAQQAAQRALQEASRALVTTTTACAAAPTPSSTPPSTPSSTPAASATPTPTASPAATPAAPSRDRTAPVLSCADALASSLAAQQRAATAQQALAAALQDAASDSTSSDGTGSDDTGSEQPSSPAQRSGGYTSTAAQVTKDTAAVAAAEVALAEAEKDLAAAVLRAPVAGTVATLPWTAGSTASPSDAAVVLGSGAVDLTVEVPSAAIRSVRPGLPATVKADGGTTTLTGALTRVGLLQSEGSDGSSSGSYPVTVRVPAGAALVDGSTAAVSIEVRHVTGVVTVPNSALRDGTVTVLKDGTATRTPVETGAKGALVTEVTSGLAAGQVVVLADLSEALPTSSTTGNRFGRGPTLEVNGGPPPGFVPGSGQVRVQRG